MEHYALSLQCSPILSPFSYASKSYENKKIHLRFNQTTLCFPQCTINHNLIRSISHANCMSSNSFSVPNSKNIETSDNNILRGINGVSIVLGCILGMFNFNSKMMNSKFNNAYAINPNVESFSGGERSFNSLWNSMNAELIESEIKFNSPPTVDNKKKHALYLRKCGKKDKVEEKLNELKSEYIKSKDEYSAIERSVRLSLMELLLIQGHFDEARKFLDEEIDILVNPKRRKIDLEKKISKLLDIYNNKSKVLIDSSPLLQSEVEILHDDDGSKSNSSNNKSSSASFTGSVFNLSTTIIGAGIMALPAAMKVLGLTIGIVSIIFLALLTHTSLDILMRFSKVAKAQSYGDVMGFAFGSVGRLIFQIAVLLNNFGILVVYTIIIGDVLSGTSSSGIHHFGVLEGWFGEHWSTGRTFVLFVTTLVVFTPLGFFKRIDSLRYTSGLAVALAIVFLVITAGITIFKLFNGSIESPRLLPNITDMTSIWNLFTAAPVLVTAFVCHYNVHTIDNELGDSSPIQPVISASLVLCSSIYILTALFGFLLFGESTLDDVLANFDADLGIPYSHLLNDIVRISYALHLMLVFPVIFFSLRFNLDDLVFPSAGSLELDNCRFSLITTGLISLLYVAANFVPSIWDVFQFTGATATVCLGFIFPAAIALRDPHSIASKKDKILSIVMIILAVFSNVVAIYSNADALFRKHQSESNLDRHFAWPMKIQQ